VGTFGLANTNVLNPSGSFDTPVIDMNTVVHRRIFFFQTYLPLDRLTHLLLLLLPFSV
jgi:hypothetical protein